MVFPSLGMGGGADLGGKHAIFIFGNAEFERPGGCYAEIHEMTGHVSGAQEKGKLG